ncbi:LolA family protein [Paraburkholderia dinghuensis]|uniref:Outer membrane lipoprotein carrier protein LolA n=1 Tax=Paraburkholderia dinghuensis TaxID=2305225 RepID=A0A3N6NY24_9BURK|nr:outer membrane lipoprotein carrier protein LolA [Paraburkholderia dinghuensis]RQH05733.1 outer membrane lipoprotein carrier protein LolA [Paraburkholderia dinghuensis]
MGTLKRRAVVSALIVLQALWMPARAETALSGVSTSDAALVSQITARLARAKGVRARFTQTQKLAAMKAPLVSVGSLLFFRDRGVIWQVDTPYRKTWVIGDSGIVAIDAGGARLSNGAAQGSRGAVEIAKMMRAMLGGDLSALYSQFDVEASGSQSRWQMRLVPRQPQIAQSLRAIQMDGGDFLKSLSITLANGDVTQFDFSGSEEVDELTPADQKNFGTR